MGPERMDTGNEGQLGQRETRGEGGGRGPGDRGPDGAVEGYEPKSEANIHRGGSGGVHGDEPVCPKATWVAEPGPNSVVANAPTTVICSGAMIVV